MATEHLTHAPDASRDADGGVSTEAWSLLHLPNEKGQGTRMSAVASVAGAQRSDTHAVKQWAAEDFAIAIGLLRECPYHGQPFKAHKQGLTAKAIEAGLADPLDPIVQIFNGNTRELLAAVESVAGAYGDRCEFCAASEYEDFD